MDKYIEDKARVLRDFAWLPEEQRRLSLAHYLLSNGIEESNGYTSIDGVLSVMHKYEELMPVEWSIAARINKNHYERVRRLKRRIYRLCYCTDGATFLTLTWRDSVFETTSPETRRRYVSRFLNSFGVEYVANIDFGGQTNREHYHAVIQGKNLDLSLWETEYGFFDARAISAPTNQTAKEAATRLAKYVAKLTNHAIKETTKGSTILYSRKKTANLRFDLDGLEEVPLDDLPF